MPSKTAKQARTMRAAAHDPAFATKIGIPTGVAKEFVAADTAKAPRSRPDRQQINKPKTRHGDQSLFSRGGSVMAKEKFPKSEAMGKVKTAAPSRDGIAERGKTKGKHIVMAGANKMCGGGRVKKK